MLEIYLDNFPVKFITINSFINQQSSQASHLCFIFLRSFLLLFLQTPQISLGPFFIICLNPLVNISGSAPPPPPGFRLAFLFFKCYYSRRSNIIQQCVANAHNLNAQDSLSIPISPSLFNVEINIVHSMGRLLNLCATKQPSKSEINDMCNMILPKQSLTEASHQGGIIIYGGVVNI